MRKPATLFLAIPVILAVALAAPAAAQAASSTAAAAKKTTAARKTKAASGSSKARTAASKPATAKKAAARKSTSAKGTARKKASARSRGSRRARAPRVPAWKTGQMQPAPERYAEIQQALIDKGYATAPADGQWGDIWTQALKRFQADQKLDASGKITSLSLMALGLGPKHESPAAVERKADPVKEQP